MQSVHKDIFSFSFLPFLSLRYLLIYTVIKLATGKKESNADEVNMRRVSLGNQAAKTTLEHKYYSS